MRWCPRCGRSSTRSRDAAPRRHWSSASVRRGAPARCGCQRPGWIGPRPAATRGAHSTRGGDRADPRGARRPAPQRHHDHVGAGGHGHRTLGAGRAGRPVRARRQCGLSVERRDERGSRADRRRGSLVIASPPQAQFDGLPHPDDPGCRRDCSASTKCGRSAVRRRLRCSPTAAPTPTARTRAGRHDHRARQHLRHRRQANLPLHRSESTPRPGRPRSRYWPTTPPIPCTSPPT